MSVSIDYISPSALKSWEYDAERWFLQRFCGRSFAQTAPMAVGSAFDAYVKGYISEYLFGRVAGFGFEELFESQVDAMHRDTALVAGGVCFDKYKSIGSLARLMEMLSSCSGVRLEHQITRVVDGVPLLGRPDLIFTCADGTGILDWKVNGYYSAASPAVGYADCGGVAHKRYVVAGRFGGMSYCNGSHMWQDQLVTYHKIIGSEGFSIIEQLAWRNGEMRVATHRNMLTDNGLMARYHRMWDHVQAGHLFPDMSLADSRDRQVTLSFTAYGEL